MSTSTTVVPEELKDTVTLSSIDYAIEFLSKFFSIFKRNAL